MTYIPLTPISLHTSQMSRPWKALHSSVKGLVQCHSLWVVYAPEHRHGSSQIPESRPLPSLCRPKGIAGGLHIWFSNISYKEERQKFGRKNALKTTLWKQNSTEKIVIKSLTGKLRLVSIWERTLETMHF
jgi:hypothetical protein